MHETADRAKAIPMEKWSIDELLAEHDRLQRRVENVEIPFNIKDTFWMINIGCELEFRGIYLDKYYSPPVVDDTTGAGHSCASA